MLRNRMLTSEPFGLQGSVTEIESVVKNINSAVTDGKIGLF